MECARHLAGRNGETAKRRVGEPKAPNRSTKFQEIASPPMCTTLWCTLADTPTRRLAVSFPWGLIYFMGGIFPAVAQPPRPLQEFFPLHPLLPVVQPPLPLQEFCPLQACFSFFDFAALPYPYSIEIPALAALVATAARGNGSSQETGKSSTDDNSLRWFHSLGFRNAKQSVE
jgi:hypothetical protein